MNIKNKRVAKSLFACVFTVFAVTAIPNQANASSNYNYSNGIVSGTYCQTGFCGGLYYGGDNNYGIPTRFNGINLSYRYYQQPQRQQVQLYARYTYQRPTQTYRYSYRTPYYYVVVRQQRRPAYNLRQDFNQAYNRVMREAHGL